MMDVGCGVLSQWRGTEFIGGVATLLGGGQGPINDKNQVNESGGTEEVGHVPSALRATAKLPPSLCV